MFEKLTFLVIRTTYKIEQLKHFFIAHYCMILHNETMKLSFTLGEKEVFALKELDNAFSKMYADLKFCSSEELETLYKYARVSMIGASTRIENAQLTDVEVNWLDTVLTEEAHVTSFIKNKELIENKLSKDRERSIEEVAGCREMLLLIYENPGDFIPLKENDVRALHHSLMAYYPKANPYAGKYKTQPNSVIEYNEKTKERRVVFETAPAGPITQAAMRDLIGWYNATLSLSPWAIAVACEFVYRFLSIHPFQDGNGRLGRGLFLLSLLHSQSEAISFVSRYLPIDRFVEKYRQEYYFTLNRCSSGKFQQDPKKYHIEHFLMFMVKILREAMNYLFVLRKRYAAEKLLSPSASTVLKCFRDFPELRLTSGRIEAETKLPKRTIAYSLSTLVEKSLIQKYGQGAGTRYQLVF